MLITADQQRKSNKSKIMEVALMKEGKTTLDQRDLSPGSEYILDLIEEIYPKIIFMDADHFYCLLCVLLRAWSQVHQQSILVGADMIRDAVYQDVFGEEEQ